MAKMYCQWVGIILLALGIIGFLTPELLTLHFTPLHNVIHLASGAILAYLGFTGTSVKVGAQAFGVVYTLVALIGFVQGTTVLNLFPVNTLYNVIHLVVGVLGLWAGFGKEMAAA
jgi:hypothetical protein